jgi:hypothetical protein
MLSRGAAAGPYDKGAVASLGAGDMLVIWGCAASIFWLFQSNSRIIRTMKTDRKKATARDLSLQEAMHLQALESNPLDAEQIAMFEMFDREGWSDERRRNYIRKRVLDRVGVSAAE